MSESKLKNSNLSPLEWINEFMIIHKITYDYKTDSIKQKDNAIDSRLALSNVRLSALSNGMGHIKNYLPDAIAVWKKEQSKLALESIKASVSFSTSLTPTTSIDTWVKGVTGSSDNLNIKVMELDGAEGIDINKLKQVITAPSLEYRVMKSEAFFSSKQNCTFIGCTNSPVRERIKDSTSARRFWEIQTQDKIDWNIINGLDYLALWKSVNETAPSPILPFLSELQLRQQAELRSKSLIEEWIESCCRFEELCEEGSTTQELYNYFKKWCRWQNLSSIPTLQKFSRDLKVESKMLGLDLESIHSYRGTTWPIKVIHIF